jgi:hypothetical protein
MNFKTGNLLKVSDVTNYEFRKFLRTSQLVCYKYNRVFKENIKHALFTITYGPKHLKIM